MKNIAYCHDLTGQKFGRLTVIGLDDTKQTRKTYWICECECGGIKSARSDSLLCGAIKSCGCMKKEQDKKNLDRTSHGHEGIRLYYIWQGMKKRCYNINDTHYHRYGGRGIVVCDEWKNDFEAFYDWALLNGYSEGLTIDRIDNDGNYEPANCHWATNQEQANNRSTNIKITIGNATKTLQQWCDIFEVDYKMVVARYHRNENMSLEELFDGKTVDK